MIGIETFLLLSAAILLGALFRAWAGFAFAAAPGAKRLLGSCAMQHERPDLGGDDLDEIWRSAQRRRSQDVYSWFTEIFKKRRQLKSPDTRPHYVGAPFRKALDGTKGGRSGR